MYGHGGIIPPFRFDMMLMLMLVLMAEVWKYLGARDHLPVPVLCCTEIRTAALRMYIKTT